MPLKNRVNQKTIFFALQDINIEPAHDEDNYMAFSFQDLSDGYGFNNRFCDHQMRLDLLNKMRTASSCTWETLKLKRKQDGGLEPLPIEKFKHILPTHLDPKKMGSKLFVLRFNSQNARLIGYQVGRVFHIVFVDPNLKLYDHGS